MIGLLINYQKNKFLRYFRTRRTAKLITVGLFMVVFFGIAFGVYLFFREGFSYITADEYFRDAFLLFVYEVYLLLFMYLLIFSVLITGLFSMFRGKNDDWVMSSPMAGLLPRQVFLKSLINSIWPFLIIVLPVLLAHANVLGLPWLGLIMIVISSIFFIIFIVSLVYIFIFGLAYARKVISKILPFGGYSINRMALFSLLLIALSIWVVWTNVIDSDLIQMFKAEDLESKVAGIDLVSYNFRALPTHYLAMTIVHWQRGESGLALMATALLFTLTALFGALFWYLSRKILSMWQIMQEGVRPLMARAALSRSKSTRATRFKGSQIMVMFKKEAIVGVRNARNLMWAGFLLFIWLGQSGLNSVLGRNITSYELEASAGPAMIQALQFATAVFFVSAFVLRFVFPAFSSERKTAWILNSAPINFKKIMYAKLSFYFVFLAVIGAAISYLNLGLLDFTFTDIGVIITLFMTAVLFLSVFGLALGAIFPNMETDDPSVLSTSLPGLGFVAGSLLYGALGAYVLYSYIVGGTIGFAFAYVLLSAILIIYFLYQAPRSLERTDFVKTY